MIIGCVADDFTGASDLASFLEKAGARCLLVNGLPDGALLPPAGYDAIVIALKTRSALADSAIRQSLAAFSWLIKGKPRMLYFKYCSTFDSTPSGNIGPVLDALVENFHLPYTILCPSLPVNRRTVEEGILYVSGIPLGESSMKNHPVNPMWDSFIPALMEPQSHYPCYVIEHELLVDSDALQKKISAFKKKSPHFYLVPDYIDNQQGEDIAAAFSGLFLASGGSALPPHFYRMLSKNTPAKTPPASFTSFHSGRVLMLSGSCSDATNEQIIHYIAAGNKFIRLCASKLLSGEQTVDEVWQEILSHNEDLLVYSYCGRENSPGIDQVAISAALESAVAELGMRAINAGIHNIIVAGGETSGAVIQKLGFKSFGIGPAIAPGVPVLFPTDRNGVQIALKSGNFGGPDFFTRAVLFMKEGHQHE